MVLSAKCYRMLLTHLGRECRCLRAALMGSHSRGQYHGCSREDSIDDFRKKTPDERNNIDDVGVKVESLQQSRQHKNLRRCTLKQLLCTTCMSFLYEQLVRTTCIENLQGQLVQHLVRTTCKNTLHEQNAVTIDTNSAHHIRLMTPLVI